MPGKSYEHGSTRYNLLLFDTMYICYFTIENYCNPLCLSIGALGVVYLQAFPKQLMKVVYIVLG